MESELYVKQAFHSKKFHNPNVSPFLRKASARQQRPLTATTSPKADGLFSFPFTTSMTADHAPRAFSAEMNECLKLGGGGGGANVRVWVLADCDPCSKQVITIRHELGTICDLRRVWPQIRHLQLGHQLGLRRD